MNDIQNPLKLNIIFSVVVAVLGVLVVFVPGMVADIGRYQFYCNYFGIIMFIFGAGFAIYYFKNYKNFNQFIQNDEKKIRWDYDDALYQGFMGELNSIQAKADKKKYYMLLGVIVVLSVVLYIMLPQESKMMGISFGVFFLILATAFVLVLPYSFRIRSGSKPYCSIVTEDQALIMGRYHHWTNAKAKVKEHDNGQRVYRVLAINYESFTSNGKMFKEWNALLPDESPETIQNAKNMANKINRRTKDIANQGKKKDILERAFDKMLNRKDEIKK